VTAVAFQMRPGALAARTIAGNVNGDTLRLAGSVLRDLGPRRGGGSYTESARSFFTMGDD